jgi:hypothetical protein
MLDELRKLLEEREKAWQTYRQAYDESQEAFYEKLLEILPYKGKMIKIKEDTSYSTPLYIKVEELFKHGSKIIIRGYGFISEFTDYRDAIWSNWDFMRSYEFEIDFIEHEVKKIHIISEVEFNSAFDKMINNMRYAHMKEML